jgi:hypothetical protein|tara:strand:- start:79 stop:384 length:306 start_codon:yes stop_codon:yes gene_type:complete
MKNIFLLLIIFTMGCASSRTLFKENQATFIRPPLPAKMELREIDWKFVNVNSNALFALDNESYLNLSKNMVDMAEYIQKLRIVIQTYETNNFNAKLKTNSD